MSSVGVGAGVGVEQDGNVTIVTIDRPEVSNAVDRTTAAALVAAFESFDADPDSSVAVLAGSGGTFCSGADLSALGTDRGNRVSLDPTDPGPMGPTRMQLSKPVIAAVEGHAVAGGLELAIWCDLRVAAADATFGVYCRRWGVPLIDGGTVRLPRLIGGSRATDMILSGRSVDAAEAERIGLVNRICESGDARRVAVELAHQIAAFPQVCVRSDLASTHAQWGHDEADALMIEVELGLRTATSAETRSGVARFVGGEGRHGEGV